VIELERSLDSEIHYVPQKIQQVSDAELWKLSVGTKSMNVGIQNLLMQLGETGFMSPKTQARTGVQSGNTYITR